MNEWKKVRLDTIGKIVTGKTPKTSQKENFGDDILFLTPSDDMCSKYCYSTKRMLSTQGGSEVKNCILPINSICVSCIGSDLGKVIKTTKTTVTNQQINSIIVNDDFDNDFIYYALIILGQELKFISKTSTAVPIVNKSTFSNYEIYLPDNKIDQTRIAKILSSLDDKIELNNRINKNLEEQAQALFKQWFVDFEFPNTDGKPYRSSGGEMIESELGMIPKGWKVGNLGDIIELFDSKRIPLSGNERDNMEKIYPYYGATTLMDYVDDYLFDGIYLLLGEDGTVVDNNGFPILQYVWGKFWVNNHAHIMQGKNGFSVELLYTLLKNTSVQQLVTGAVQPKINQANLKAIHIIIPDLVMLNMFDDFIQSIYILTRKNKDENQNLAQMRDALLPRLMNGDAEI